MEFNKAVAKSLLKTLEGVMSVKEVSDTIFEINTGEHDIREAIFQLAVKNEFAVLSMQKVEKGLEEVFHQLTNKPASE